MTAPDDLNALAEARKEIERLEKLVYVPGLWRCAKCNLRLVSNTLYADSGKMTANNSPQQCANGCGPMWRVTEREAANEQIDRNEALREELASIKAGDSVVVPRVPSEEMYCAGDEAICKALEPINPIADPTPAQLCYQAMLAAAPKETK